jgi:hypothetical protein
VRRRGGSGRAPPADLAARLWPRRSRRPSGAALPGSDRSDPAAPRDAPWGSACATADGDVAGGEEETAGG